MSSVQRHEAYWVSEAAEDEADGGAAARDAAVDGEGAGPLLGLGEGHGQQGQGRRRHDRRRTHPAGRGR